MPSEFWWVLDLRLEQRGRMDEYFGRWKEGISWQRRNGLRRWERRRGRRVFIFPSWKGFFWWLSELQIFLDVYVGEDTDDFRETVWLEDVEKFKGFLYYFKKKCWRGWMLHTTLKQKEPSTMSNTRSSIFPMSIILLTVTTKMGCFPCRWLVLWLDLLLHSKSVLNNV